MILGLAVFICIIIFLIIDTKDQRIRLVSASGVLVILLIGLLISKKPGKVKWRQVLVGITLQFFLGMLVLRWETGRNVLDCLSNKVRGKEYRKGFI